MFRKRTTHKSRAGYGSRKLGFEFLESREMLSITPLTDLPIDSSTDTGEKPQSKVWTYADQWWSVVPESDGTWISRLDGDSWTQTTQLTSNSSINADVKADDSLAHVLLFDGTDTQLASIEYDASLNNYMLWDQRPNLVDMGLPSGIETATIDVDSLGRMWIAFDQSSSVEVRYSDGLYTDWSDSIVLASNIDGDDISVITAMPDNTVGVLWSNQSTERFGFRYHVDGANPTQWSTDEVPASQSASNTGGGMADDHLNVAVASDGTLYAAVKTSYDGGGQAKIALLVRRPDGQWDNMYDVASSGTRPIVILNEDAGRLIVAYTESDSGGDILYKETATNNISFGSSETLISGSLNNATSTKQNFSDEVVVLASRGSTAEGVLFSFGSININAPPQVSAGSSQTITLGGSATLVGSASDDGLPNSGTLTTSWTVVSGPGSVNFGSSSSTTTTAQFSAAGSYVLQLTANDGQLMGSDQVTVSVSSVSTSSAGPVGEWSLDSTSGGTVVDTSGHGHVGTVNGSPQAINGPSGSALQLDGSSDYIEIEDTPLLDITDQITISTWIRPDEKGTQYLVKKAEHGNTDGFELSLSSKGKVFVRFNQDSDKNDHRLNSSTSYSTNGSEWMHVVATYDGSSIRLYINGQLDNSVNDQFTITTNNLPLALGAEHGGYRAFSGGMDDVRIYNHAIDDAEVQSLYSNQPAAPTNQAPQVNAGSNQTITLGESATLVGSASDDGLPNSGTLTTSWTVVSGPGSVNFGSSSSTTTTAQFSTAGSYVLQLTANDGQLIGSDQVTVTVNPAAPTNQAPQVNAGSNQTITLGESATLVGSASDDGLPNSGTLTTSWTVVSGPGSVNFGSSSSTTATAQFSTAGSYVLQLTANDGQLIGSDQVTVTVNPAAPTNQAPQVNAGSNQTITLGGSATLVGSASDDGLPNSGTLTTSWTVVSGPGSVNFGSSSSTTTTAQFSAAGSYVLQLTANDGQLIGSDQVTVTVNPAAPTNQAPQVNAGSNQTITLGESATLVGSASDDGLPNSGTLTTSWTVVSGPGSVNFGSSSSTTATAQFSTAGSYVLQLTANDGQLIGSDQVTVTVNPAAPTNQAPQVNAGSNQTITLGGSATLVGSASDDGLPNSGTLTTSWTVVSGPGSVNFGSSSSTTTTAQFSAAGSYVLQLTANDGQLMGSDQVTVSVSSVSTSPAGLVGEWSLDSTSGGTVVDTSGHGHVGTVNGSPQAINGPSGSALQLDGSSDYIEIEDTPLLDITDQITISTWIRPDEKGTQYLVKKAEHGNTDGFELSLSSKGKVFVRFNQDSDKNDHRLDSSTSYSTNGSEWMHVVATYDGSSIRLYINGQLDNSVNDQFTITTNNLPLALGAEHGGYRAFSGGMDDVRIYNHAIDDAEVQSLYSNQPAAPTNQAPQVNAGSNWTITLGESVTLVGSASDDGLPNSGTLTTSWTVVSGPGSVNFGSSSSTTTTAQFSAAGSYVLQLTANDGQLMGSDQVTVTVNPAAPTNQAPQVNAGSNQTITLGESATLVGSASDDGLPNSGTLTTSWTVVSGPGSVNFGSSSSTTTTAQFSTAGSYVLQLTANDGQLIGSDQVTVTVNPAAPTNQAPQVNAGSNQTITLGESATLVGSASDDGLPNSGTLTTSWTVVSGPGSVNFGSSSSTTATAQFSTAGSYVLQLTANDGQLIGSDQVTVTVNPAAPTNQAPQVNAGSNQTITLGGSATLVGSASDDGLPNSGTLTTSWTVVSGPGSVNFGSSSSTTTTAQFSAAGSYVLQLTANDGQLMGSDQVTVSVSSVSTSPAGLVGEWSLDSTSGGTVVDTSGHGHVGTVNGSPQAINGPSGSALQLDGSSDYIEIEDTPLLDITDQITISTWIRPDEKGTQYLVKKAEHGNTDGFELSLSSKGKVFVRFNQDSDKNDHRLDSSTSYSTNGSEWMHVVATYDGSSIRLYINGQLDNSVNDQFTITTNNLPLALGAEHGGYRAFSGGMDDVRIYNHAIDDAEVQSLYSNV
ncbi:LamG domain-containing protein [Adhaeretor mobilis]|uniref:Beta-L-arabinobiosidase n=1 Tax=Adhaeretor mobilis TaxID=1930276 RepID=A0A517MPR8_9BACT|nr:LamG domain-containing protein [Adhaeretor mobilis]QDS96869.1 Beta-L-arabinobiosidase precursor [Adhaeretor mobilis]